MKNKLLFVVVVILASIYFKGSLNQETSFSFENGNEQLINKKISDEDLNEYLLGVVAGEMPASFSNEALKAQIIAARTFAFYKLLKNDEDYDLKNDSFQYYITEDERKEKWQDDYSKYTNKLFTLIKDTDNLIITYDEQLIKPYYFAMSNGQTEDSQVVFNENEPYLQSVISLEDNNLKNFEVTIEIEKQDFCNKLNLTNCNTIKITDINRDSTNRVIDLKVNNTTFKGTVFRKKLGIRSTDFEIKIVDNILITTKGYGHGVGMSQQGANLYAKKGYTYDEILKHYYTGVEIKNINSINL